MVKCLITGVTGQTGSYLADLLVFHGDEVAGMVRRGSTINTKRVDHLIDNANFELYYGDLSDTNSIVKLLLEIKPKEIYNIGSMSQVRVSFDVPEYTGDITCLGVCRMLEAIKNLRKHKILDKNVKLYQASSSEMYGDSPPPQDENTPFHPQSPYGCSKLYGYWLTKAYRNGYNMFACNGILFNHESPRRGETFVTKKIVRSACRIKLGLQDTVTLGNLDAKRDWGHAKDYCDAIYKIMQHSEPDDFVVATGEHHTIQNFLEEVFKRLNLSLDEHVEFDKRFLRPNEVPELRGDATKIRDVLGWKPKITYSELIDDMIKSAMEEEKTGINQWG